MITIKHNLRRQHMSKSDCYIKDPKNGKFMGRKPGCTGEGGYVSEEVMGRVDQDKDRLQKWAEHVSEHGKG
jgi:hypothetical protein